MTAVFGRSKRQKADRTVRVRDGRAMKSSRVADKLSKAELDELAYFLLDVFLFVARTADGELEERERRVFEIQLMSAPNYPESLYRDLLWRLEGLRRSVIASGESDWVAALERRGEQARKLPPGTSGGVRRRGSESGPVTTLLAAHDLPGTGLQVVLMPGGDIVFEPASFPRAESLLRRRMTQEEYEFFTDTLITCAVDVVTDSWTLGKDSITLEHHAILSAIETSFGIDMQGMQERSARLAQQQNGR